MTPIVLNKDNKEMIIKDNLYFLLISTKAPKQADPTTPPKMKTAPNNEAASY